MHNDDAIGLATGESEKPEILTFCYLTKDDDNEIATTYLTAKKN